MSELLVPVLLLAVGFVLLIKGGDWFVDGATGIARRFHLPEILIGATVVSIGTTLPEVMVSAGAAAGGNGSIAYGNAIGSIICNTSLIAAITVAIRPSKIDRKSLVFPVIFFFGAAVSRTTSSISCTTGIWGRISSWGIREQADSRGIVSSSPAMHLRFKARASFCTAGKYTVTVQNKIIYIIK